MSHTYFLKLRNLYAGKNIIYGGIVLKSVSEKNNVDYWNEFYKNVSIDEESTFCSFVKNKINKNSVIIDIGCGSGRDTRSFAKEGIQVYGIDRSVEAINKNNENVRNISNIKFVNIDIADEHRLRKFIDDVSAETKKNAKKLIVYSRFFLHSINKETEKILLNILSEGLQSGDLIMLEYRTIEDESIDKIYNNHYRRYIDSEELNNNLEQNYGFTSVYFYKGQGLSVYKSENPYLARMILKKK